MCIPTAAPNLLLHAGALPWGTDREAMMCSTGRGKAYRAHEMLLLSRSSPIPPTDAQCWATRVPHCRPSGLLGSSGHS